VKTSRRTLLKNKIIPLLPQCHKMLRYFPPKRRLLQVPLGVHFTLDNFATSCILLDITIGDPCNAEENIWTKEGWSDGRVEKAA
jgi:hypothetical protein